MKMQAARSILAFGLALGMAGTALAGPTTSGSPGPTATPTPTATVTGSPTATATGSPTATPTGTVTGSPTPTATATGTVTGSPTPTATATPTGTVTGSPTPTATATGTVTGSPTPTPTATPTVSPPPSDLTGEFPFVDRDNFDKNETLMNVDSVSFCLAGRAVGVDASAVFNRVVVFTYTSLGTITKATDKAVNGAFVDVQLQLTITETTPDGPIIEADETIAVADCQLEGGLRKEGDAGKAKLKCDVGENLSAFGLVPADGESQNDQALIDNVTEAFKQRKNLKVDTKKGKIRFTHRGEPAPDNLVVPLTCDLGGSEPG